MVGSGFYHPSGHRGPPQEEKLTAKEEATRTYFVVFTAQSTRWNKGMKEGREEKDSRKEQGNKSQQTNKQKQTKKRKEKRKKEKKQRCKKKENELKQERRKDGRKDE